MEVAIFICLEGAEAVGKSTQINLLTKVLTNHKYSCFATREPGGVQEAEVIRSLIFKNDFANLTELLLFSASRHENILKEIQPSLQKYQVVLCDRFVLSTFVYQGYVKNVNPKIIANIHKSINFNLYPDLTIILDATPNNMMARIGNRHHDLLNKMDHMPKAYHEKVKAGFLAYKKFYKSPTVIVSGDLSLIQTHQALVSTINKKFKLHLVPLSEKIVQELGQQG